MIYSQKKTFKYAVILSVGVVATTLLQYYMHDDIYQEYFQIDLFILTLVPLIPALIFYILFNLEPDYIFDENYIQIIKNGNTLQIDKCEIEQIVYFTTKGKYTTTKHLAIITNNQERYGITDEEHKNFNEIKYFLQQNYHIENYKLNETPDLRIILGIILFFIFIASVASIDINDQTKGLQKMEVILSETPVIKEDSKGKYDKIEFKFKRLEKFSTSFLYKKENKNNVDAILASFHINDTLIIEIPKNYYDKKIAKTQPLTFIDKHFKYDELPMYYIGNKDSSQILIKQYP